MRPYKSKRWLDLTLILITAPVWLSLLATIGLVIRFKLGRPIFFTQRRPGYHGHIFELVKFRTMSDCRDAGGVFLPDEERLTPFGRWLRSTSLDELPELFNVLQGQMSLVGPRPLLVQYLQRYDSEQARRHDVLPGITGWAQVRGRNAISWEEKFKLDVWYVENQSLPLDLQILALTLGKVLRREGISAEGAATMHEFEGTTKTEAAGTARESE